MRACEVCKKTTINLTNYTKIDFTCLLAFKKGVAIVINKTRTKIIILNCLEENCRIEL